jgi:hypothetical protein
MTKKGKEKLKERTNRKRLGTSGLTRSSPLTRPEAKSFGKCQKQKFQTGIFSLRSNPLVLCRRKTEDKINFPHCKPALKAPVDTTPMS